MSFFLTLGEPSKAQEQLAALREICLIPCGGSHLDAGSMLKQSPIASRGTA